MILCDSSNEPLTSTHTMNFDKLYTAIDAGLPYFGEEVLGVQGNPERQRHIMDIVRHICLARKNQPIKILEIGSWIGASAITWATAIQLYNGGSGQIFCIDSWESRPFNQINHSGWNLHMENLLKHDFAFDLFNHNIQCSKMNSMIHVIRGVSSSIVSNLSNETFDIIYIDASHDYESVKRDIQNSKPKLVNSGVLCGDDLELKLEEVDQKGVKEHLEKGKDYCLDEKTGLYFHPGVTLAISEEFENVGSRDGFWFIQKHNNEWKLIEFPSTESMPLHIAGAISAASN